MNQNMEKERKTENIHSQNIAFSEQPQIIYTIEFLDINVSFLFLLYLSTAKKKENYRMLQKKHPLGGNNDIFLVVDSLPFILSLLNHTIT